MEAFKKNFITRYKEAAQHVFRFEIRPRKQWKRLVVASSLLGLGIVSFHVYFFYRVENDMLFTGPAVATVSLPVVNEKRLSEVLETFDNKALMRAAATQLVPAVGEPSR